LPKKIDSANFELNEVIIDHVSKAYGNGQFAKSVVDDCSFSLQRKKLTVMIGPSGCGKSTLIRLLAGFEAPSSGTITMNGDLVNTPSKERLVLFQETALFPWLNAYDNVMFGPRMRGEDTLETRQTVEKLLDTIGLSNFQKKYPSQLSGGMQRRVELARAMINNPQVMILDEPFRGLDAMTKKLMLEYYAQLFESSHRTHFFVTTDIDEAIYLADRLLVMTGIPTKVAATIEITLPRPRKLVDVFENEHANEIKMQALALLHKEAMKSFSGGSKAASDFVDAYSRHKTRKKLV